MGMLFCCWAQEEGILISVVPFFEWLSNEVLLVIVLLNFKKLCYFLLFALQL